MYYVYFTLKGCVKLTPAAPTEGGKLAGLTQEKNTVYYCTCFLFINLTLTGLSGKSRVL